MTDATKPIPIVTAGLELLPILPDLSQKEAVLLLYLAGRRNWQTGRCDPSVGLMMRDLRWSRSTVFRTLDALEERKLIQREKRTTRFGDRAPSQIEIAPRGRGVVSPLMTPPRLTDDESTSFQPGDTTAVSQVVTPPRISMDDTQKVRSSRVETEDEKTKREKVKCAADAGGDLTFSRPAGLADSPGSSSDQPVRLIPSHLVDDIAEWCPRSADRQDKVIDADRRGVWCHAVDVAEAFDELAVAIDAEQPPVNPVQLIDQIDKLADAGVVIGGIAPLVLEAANHGDSVHLAMLTTEAGIERYEPFVLNPNGKSLTPRAWPVVSELLSRAVDMTDGDIAMARLRLYGPEAA